MELHGLQHDLLARLLDASTLRQRVIADNVANQNTPGYLRQTVEFEELLRQVLDKGSAATAGIEPELHLDTETPTRPDGNNVQLETEVASMNQNRLLYEAYMSIGAMRMELIRTAIETSR